MCSDPFCTTFQNNVVSMDTLWMVRLMLMTFNGTAAVLSNMCFCLSPESKNLLKRRLTSHCLPLLSLTHLLLTSQMSKPWWTPSTLFQVQMILHFFMDASPTFFFNNTLFYGIITVLFLCWHIKNSFMLNVPLLSIQDNLTFNQSTALSI